VDTDGIGGEDLTAAVPPIDGDWDIHADGVTDGFGVCGWNETWHLSDMDPGHPESEWAYPPGSMVVETARGPQLVDPATEDTDGDGRADTAVVPTKDGLLLITDVDGDGSADQVVDMDDTGAVTVSDHTDHGRWTVTEESQLDATGRPTLAPGSRAVGTDDSDWVFDEVTRATGDQQDGGDSDSVWV
jgi:hypothetical protein